MYKINLGGDAPVYRELTGDSRQAAILFRRLISRRSLVGKKAFAILSLDGRQLMYHRFDRYEGDKDFVSWKETIKTSHD